MNSKNFPAGGIKSCNQQLKGDTYGAGRIRRGGDKAAGLKINGRILRSRGAVHNPRPGNYHKRFETDADRQMERRVRNVLKGFTTQGQPRQRRPNYVNAQAAREARLQRNLDRQARIARERKAAGLRTDGKPFRRRQNFHSWKMLRSTMRVPLVSFEDVTVEGLGGTYK